MTNLVLGAALTGSARPPATFSAILRPTMSPIIEGQSISDTADFQAMTDTANFTSSAGPVVSAVVAATGDAPDTTMPLAKGYVAGFTVTVTNKRGDVQVFHAGQVTVAAVVPDPVVTFSALLTPAMSPLYAGQSVRDTADFPAITDTANFSSSAGPVVSAVVAATGDAAQITTPLAEGDVAGFTVTVTDDKGNARVFEAGPTTVEYKVTVGTTADNEADIDINPIVPDGETLVIIISDADDDNGTYTPTAGDLRNNAYTFSGTVDIDSSAGTNAGDTLTGDDGLWTTPTESLTLTRQWRADGVAIPGATEATFQITATEQGKDVTLAVTGDDGVSAPVTAISPAVSIPAAAGGFHPTDLFASGEAGFLFIMSDPANIRAADDGSGAAPSVDDPIGYVQDLSGNGNHATSSGTVRPLLKSDATGLYLQFDGVDDYLEMAAAIGISGSQNRTFVAVADQPGFGQNTVFYYSAGTRWSVSPDSGNGNMRISIAGGGYTSALTTGDLAVYGCVLNGTRLADHTLHKNDASENATGATVIDTADRDTRFGGSHVDAPEASEIRFGLMIDRALTTGEQADLHAWLYTAYGITP